MKQGILTINAGSSSIKFALFELNDGLARHPSLSGQIDGLGAEARLVATHGSGQAFPEVGLKPGVQHQEAFDNCCAGSADTTRTTGKSARSATVSCMVVNCIRSRWC